MKKLAYVTLTSILALTLIEAYSTAHADRVEYTPFEERLKGTVSGGTISIIDKWTEITEQIITGFGRGTLLGSPITFIMTAQIRYREGVRKSFTSGIWTIVASDGRSSISGRFLGTGTDLHRFSGTFKSFNDTGTGIYYGKMISGEFQSWYLEPEEYGAPWKYKALWTGTVKGTG